jgi:hypothetical protein
MPKLPSPTLRCAHRGGYAHGWGGAAVTYASAFNTIGLLMNLAGIFLLFVFGMPFRARTGSRLVKLLEQPNPQAIRAEGWYDMFGWLGLALIVLKATFL